MNRVHIISVFFALSINVLSFSGRHEPVAAEAAPLEPIPTNLVPQGATWRYLDTGMDLGTAWRAPDFDDSQWPAGPSELGYGDDDEATLIGYGGDVMDRHITTYFRHTFTVSHPDQIRYLKLWMHRDDGAVIYLNGKEIWRENMRDVPLTAKTLAQNVVGDHRETEDLHLVITAEELQPGANVFAAEVHQITPISLDLTFDFSATAVVDELAPSLTRGPYLQQATPTSAVVCWRTDIPAPGWVRYGDTPDHLDTTVTVAELQRDHQVLLPGLKPETTYYYAVGSGECTLVSPTPEHTLTTHPPAGSIRPTRIWVLGDSGTANDNARSVRDAYIRFAGDRPSDFTLMLGDNAYDNGTELEYQAAVFDMYGDQLRNQVFWSTLGNHDGHSAFSNTGQGPYYRIFHLPTQGEAGGAPSGTEAYYSFDYANIHFICLNSYDVNRSPKGAMHAWLKADLAQLRSDWVIAFWHHPPYSKGSHNSDTEQRLIDMRKVYLPLLEEAGVDLVLGGHSHCYERSKLINGHYGTSDTLTDAMILDGGPGHPYTKPAHEGAVYTVAGSSGKVSGGELNHPVMHISLNELGSLVIDINDKRMDTTFVGANPDISDHFSIVKPDAARR